MSIVRRTPHEMLSFRSPFDRYVDRVFDESWVSEWPELARRAEKRILLDIYEKEDNVVVKAALPGVLSDHLDVQVREDVLTIRADLEDEEERREENYYMHEQRHGHFERSVLLPNPVIADRAEAEFENGILTLRLPKSSETTTRKIKIRKK